MKKIQLLLAFCGFSILAWGQQHFTVQAGMFLNAKSEDFDGVRDLGFVYAEVSNDNVYRVFVGAMKKADADKVTATPWPAGLWQRPNHGNRLSEVATRPSYNRPPATPARSLRGELGKAGDSITTPLRATI
ncbi:MAG: hypothetical protein IPN33_22280 [Saprospiraceae bacterium]|nr:hypothetical protein [Saprospiraceae bacterium]